jgi:hypothetical protein
MLVAAWKTAHWGRKKYKRLRSVTKAGNLSTSPMASGGKGTYVYQITLRHLYRARDAKGNV